jgi:hypothetical protein
MEELQDVPSPKQTQVPTVMVAAVDSETTIVSPPEEGAELPTFRQLESDALARVVLLQTDDTHFSLVEGFRYMGKAGAWTVMPTDLPDTDLASIPPFLGWFASRYGTHTLAALLHDHLVRNGSRTDPRCARSEADHVFGIALDELGVPFLRAKLMWAAVTLATRWRAGGIVRAALMVWMVSAAIGLATLAYSVVTMDVQLFVLSLLAPIPFALLWSRKQYSAGFFGGYTLWLVALPALLNIVAFGIYSVAERLIRQLRRLHPANRATPLPGPPRYKAR